MSSPLDSVTVLLAGLATGNNCLTTLEKLRLLLVSVSTQELKDYIPKIDVDRLFTCLTTTNREQIRLACEILSLILGSLPRGQPLTKYEDLYLQGLAHPDNQVKNLILHQIQMVASDATVAHQLSSCSELLLSCLRLVGSDESNIAFDAKRIFGSLSNQGDAATVLLSPPVISEMRVIATKSDTIRYRVYEIVVAIGSTSNDMLLSIDETGFLNPLLEDVDSSDIIIQLNALELLTVLMSDKHGRGYLIQKRIIEKLSDKLSQSVSDILASLIVPGLLKFLGTFAYHQPEMLSEYSAFTNTLFNLIQDSDLSLQIVAIETISFISTEEQGKRALHNILGNRMEVVMKKMGSLVNNSNSEVRLKVVHAVAEMFHIPVNQLEDEELLAIVEEWSTMLNPKPIQLITNLMKQPFNEMRLELLTVLLNLSPQPWAQKQMSYQPGLIEFLLDRGAEPNKECTECKFRIVEKLVECNKESKFGDIWTPSVIAQLKGHAQEGPWFIRAQASVAFESGP